MPRRLSPTVILLVWLLSSLSAATTEAGSLTLAWDAPDQGSVAGYVIRYGTSSQSYTSSVDVGLVTRFTIDSLADGVTYYFAVQAYDSGKQFGPLSNEISSVTRPAAPRNLAAAVAGSSVNLTWTAPGGTVTGYRIEVGTTSGQSNVATIDTGTTTAYTINNVAPGTYYVRVRSVNGGGTSAASNEVVVTVSGTAPLGAPSGLTATVRSGTTTIDLSWRAPSSGTVTGYRVEVGSATGASNIRTVNIGTSTTYSLTGLSAGRYYIRVRALNGATTSAPSNEAVATIANSTPGAPSGLTATVRSGTTIDLSWNAASGTVTGYRVEVGSASGASNIRTVNIGTTTTYSLTGLSAGTYYIRVRALNGATTSAPSNEAVATLGTVAPGAPSQLQASVRNGTIVDLSWRASSGTVTGYRIEVGSSSGASNVRTVNVGTSTTYSLTGLSAGTYYIRVRALNGAATSAPSNEVTARIVATPNPPTGLTATVRSNRYVDLQWQAPSGTISGYRIEVGRATGQSDVTTINTGTGTTYTISSLSTGTYYIRVRSVNSSGSSAPSNEVTATLGTSGPNPPVNLRATVTNGTVIALTWGAPSTTVDSYRIEIGTAPGRNDVRTTTVGSSVRSYTISDLRGGPYYIQVRSVRGTQTSPSSNGVEVLCAPAAPTNLSASARGRSIALTWRAPSSGASEYRIEVGTASGRSDVRVVTTTATSFTIGDLSAGKYYIRVRARNAAGTSGASNEATATLTQGGRPTAPSSLTATREGGNISLRWQSMDDSTQFYRIELGTAQGQTDISSFTTGVTTSFSIGELPAQTYYVRVRAGNDQGWSDPTPDVVVPGMGGTDAPRRLSASVTANGMVRLMWDEPQDVSGLRGYLVEAGSAPGRSDRASVPTTNRRLVGGPVPPGTYFVRVRSITAAGLGSASNEVVLNVGAPQMCVAPPGAPKFAAEVLGSHIKLSWAPGAGDAPTSYLLDVGTTPGQRDIISVPLRTDVNTLTAPVPTGSYALRLIAVNACGTSAWGAEATVTVGGPPITQPGAPSGLTAQVSGRAIALSWAPPVAGGPVASYVIEVVAPNGAVLLALDTRNASTTFTHGAVPPGQYTIRVRALNASGAGDPSNPVVVTVQ
jgi:predicted phage tail protein